MSFKAWVTDLPTTPYKAVISVWLAVFVAIVFTICIALKQELQVEAMYGVFIFVGSLYGADVTQFIYKRKTEIVTPPQTTAENATASTVAATPTTPAVLTRADADRATRALDERQRAIQTDADKDK